MIESSAEKHEETSTTMGSHFPLPSPPLTGNKSTLALTPPQNQGTTVTAAAVPIPAPGNNTSSSEGESEDGEKSDGATTLAPAQEDGGDGE